jgi:coenzyme F420-0:L-glutamate ligase/coenzyme F420-1:gamma-L-glutamate ligase
MTELRIIPIAGLPEVAAGDSLAELIAARAALADGDVVVVTQKVVSKAEGRLVDCDRSDDARRRALIDAESVRILRTRNELLITETRQGFVCANAGIDFSNVPAGQAALLPVDPDRSARGIRDGLVARTHRRVAVIVSDTFGRGWRRGLTDVAIGCAGVAALLDLRGTPDATGRDLAVTQVAVADELAAAAELVMGKASGVAAAVVRGVDPAWLRESSVRAELVRAPQEDLFR